MDGCDYHRLAGAQLMTRKSPVRSRSHRAKRSKFESMRMTPEASESFSKGLAEFGCVVGRPRPLEAVTDTEGGDQWRIDEQEVDGGLSGCEFPRLWPPRMSPEAARKRRVLLGGEYIAAIAEQRPGITGHGYPAGHPDWDQPLRLLWSGSIGSTDGTNNWTDWYSQDRSMVLPYWMALPLVRNSVLRRDEPVESPVG